jgi:hypothetical protein
LFGGGDGITPMKLMGIILQAVPTKKLTINFKKNGIIGDFSLKV